MNDDRSLGVGVTHIGEFFDDIRGRIRLLSMSDEELQQLCKEKEKELGCVLTPQEMKRAVRRPVLVIGDPGVGKTCGIVGAIADHNAKHPDNQWGFKKILLGQTIVGALQGIPIVDTSTHTVIREDVPDLPVAERDGKYGILFLDEITTADEAQVQPALGLTDDTRNLGTYTLPENWLVVAAGNGPNCANFRELHDMTISRFVCYNVYCDFARDWEPWAREHGIDPLILAYLNFKKEDIVKIASDVLADPDVGKAFASPRTWTRLSEELKIRKALGRKVSQNELFGFASRIIGEEVGNSFASFAAFRSEVKFDADKILKGTEKMPKEALRGAPLREEVYQILMESLISSLTVLCKNAEANEVARDVEYKQVANAVRWIIDLSECQMLDMTITAFAKMATKVPHLKKVMLDDDFCNVYCPEFDDFCGSHTELLIAIRDALSDITKAE